MNEKISVIIPAYNVGNFLAQTLDSVLAQTYKNLEVIVVNDGSVDQTGEIMALYAKKDARIRTIHQENSGVTGARLRGVAEATGDWIGFVDGDDVIEPDMYGRLLRNAQAYQAQISHCGYQMVFPDGHVDFYHNTGKILDQRGLDGCRDLLQADLVEPGLVTKLYRRDLLEGIENRMDRSIRINEDVLMNYDLFKRAERCVFEDICPYHYVLRQNSAATAATNAYKLRDPIRVIRLIGQDCDERLKGITDSRLANLLIRGATRGKETPEELVTAFRRDCRRELRQLAKNPDFWKRSSRGLKIKVLWTAVWPASYALVHRLYGWVTGADRLYDLK